MSAQKPAVIYAEELLKLDLGYALWDADPYGEYDKVKIGDVGYIHRGKFIPKWNYWSDLPANNGKKPKTRRGRLEAKEPFISQSVSLVALDVGATAEVVVAGAELGLGYGCSKSTGAILALKSGFGVKDELHIEPAKELEKYVCSNVPDLLKNMTGLDHKEIVVVTGTTLTNDWDAAVWTSGSKAGTITVGGGAQMVLAKTSVAVSKGRDQSVLHSSGHHHNAEADPEFQNPNCCAPDAPPNQCVFIRGFRIKKRFPFSKFGPDKLEAAAEPKDPDQGPDDENQEKPAIPVPEEGAADKQPESVAVPISTEEEEELSIYDKIFNFIFEESTEAELAVVHDSDLPLWSKMVSDADDDKIGIIFNPVTKTASLRQPVKRALIISARYRGAKAGDKNIEILDDHTKAYRLKDLLTQKYGYEESDIVSLIEGESEKQPNKATILEEINSLTSFAGYGDSFVFYFSGHSSQEFLSKDDDGRDGNIETIWPMDYSGNSETLIRETELYEALAQPLLSIKCRLAAIFDICHGETTLDLSGTVDFNLQEVKDVTNFTAGEPVGIDDFDLEESKKLAALSLEDDGPSPAPVPEGGAPDEPVAPAAPPPAPEATEPAPVPAPAPAEPEPAAAPDPEEPVDEDGDGDDDAGEGEDGDGDGDGAGDNEAGSDAEGDPQPQIPIDQGFDSQGKAVDDNALFGRLPPNGPTKFQVNRGRLGLRENYISITAQLNQLAEGSSTALEVPSHTVIWFTRRAALRLREKEEVEVYEPVVRFPGGSEDTEARRNLIEEAFNYLEILLPKIDDLIKTLAPATTSKLLMETFLEALQQIPETRGLRGATRLLHARMVVLAEFLTGRMWLLEDSQSDNMRIKRQTLLLLVFDLVAFHDKMRRLAAERARTNITPERAESEEKKNEDFGTKFENQLTDMYQDLQGVKPSDLKADPTGEGLRRQENSYEPPLPHPLKATITSWSTCLPTETYWSEKRRPAGVDTALIDILSETPKITYRTLIQELTQQLHTQATNNGHPELLSDRAQLGSLTLLDLDTEFTL